jgi:single-strand DNA-binding protein
MASRSLNKVLLIGNLTRDPELRYTPTGAAVCTIGLATNRTWVTDSGEKKEETEFHRVVAWNKLAELCSQLLAKGRKVYVEGRLRTSAWQAQDGTQRTSTEIVIEDMIVLDSKRPLTVGDEAGSGENAEAAHVQPQPVAPTAPAAAPKKKAAPAAEKGTAPVEDVNPDDIPF